MSPVLQRRLTGAAVVGLAWWFFGNLYEAVVLSPNWAIDTADRMQDFYDFTVRTGPTLYFVPITQLAVALLWVLVVLNRVPQARGAYLLAGLLALLATAVNVVIVATVVPELFGDPTAVAPDRLADLALRWNVLNVVRLLLTGAAAFVAHKAYRCVDRAGVPTGQL
ncbi:hypothetical protein [Pseudonocardia sp. WMMC193]|uniref:hypothetical protein n=1 Tax=Pseudonocardia sp. WMMC193 TaxID=2911965 RepID=UPI001F2FD099|nr:hypothetical protein [Pseudonocardia sp. WMMC193]MCF7548559.1 hypothetical protein [Pseudonocardia sp. WMMC193]